LVFLQVVDDIVINIDMSGFAGLGKCRGIYRAVIALYRWPSEFFCCMCKGRSVGFFAGR